MNKLTRFMSMVFVLSITFSMTYLVFKGSYYMIPFWVFGLFVSALQIIDFKEAKENENKSERDLEETEEGCQKRLFNEWKCSGRFDI